MSTPHCVNAFATGDGAAVFGAVDRVVEGGHDPRRFAADLLDRLRDLIILAAVPGAGHSGLLAAPADRLERMAEQSGRFGQAELTRAAEIISEGLIQMRGTTSPRGFSSDRGSTEGRRGQVRGKQ